MMLLKLILSITCFLIFLAIIALIVFCITGLIVITLDVIEEFLKQNR